MLNLIRNELKKIFLRKSTYVLLLLVTLASVGMFTLYHFAGGNGYDDQMVDSDIKFYEELRNYETQGTYQYMLADRNLLCAKLSTNTGDIWKYRMGIAKISELHMVMQNQISEDGFKTEEEYYRWKDNLTYENEHIVKVKVTKSLYDKLVKEKEESVKSIESATINSYYEELMKGLDKDSLTYQKYADLLAHNIKPDAFSNRESFWDAYISASENYEYAKEKDDKRQMENLLPKVLAYKYILDHNLMGATIDNTINTDSTDFFSFYSKFWGLWCDSSSVLSLLGVIMIIIAGGCIAKEYSEGTIKFLLINPIKRQRIFWSKYFSLLLFTLVATVGIMILNGLLCLLTVGLGEGGFSYVHIVNGVVVESSMFGVLFQYYAGVLIQAVVLTTMAFMISAIFRSSSLAIGLGIGAYAFGTTITTILTAFGQDWGRYLIFANLDPWSIGRGQCMFAHQSAFAAVVTIIIYMFLMLFMARDAFVRREV